VELVWASRIMELLQGVIRGAPFSPPQFSVLSSGSGENDCSGTEKYKENILYIKYIAFIVFGNIIS